MAASFLPAGARLDELYGRREFERQWNEFLRLETTSPTGLLGPTEPAEANRGYNVTSNQGTSAPAPAPESETEPTEPTTSPADLSTSGIRPHVEPAAPADRARTARTALLTPEQLVRWDTEQAHATTFGRDLSEESFVRAFLTHPTAHSGNMRATGLGRDFTLPADAMAAIHEELFYRDAAGQERQDAARQLRATAGALEDAIRLMATSGPVGERTEPLSADAYGFDKTSVLGQAVDIFGEGRQPDDALTNAGLYRAIAYKMELGAAAERIARAEGHRGAALDARVGQLEADPTPEMIAETGSGATLRTLNTDLFTLGPRLLKWAAETPGGQLMLPFLHPHTTDPTWFGPAFPTLNELAVADRRDLESSGIAATRAAARRAIGQAVGATIAWHVAGGVITGSGQAPGLTDAPPYSLRRPTGRWVEYPHAPGTVGALVATLADYAELSARLPVHPQAFSEWVGLAAPLILATGRIMSDPTALKAVATVLGTVRDGSRHASPQKPVSGSQVSRELGMTTQEMVLRALYNEAHAVVSLAGVHLRSVWQGVPAYRDQLTGQPVDIPAGWGGSVSGPLLAFWRNSTEKDVVRRQIYENRAALPTVPWVVTRETPAGGAEAYEAQQDYPDPVELTAQERDFWITAATQQHRDDQGRTLHEALTYMMREGSPYWEQGSGPGGGRRLMIQNKLAEFYRGGKALLTNPATGSANLARDIAAAEERFRQLGLPRTNPRSPQYGMETRREDTGRRSPVREVVRDIANSIRGPIVGR